MSGAHRVMCWGGRDDRGEGRSGQQVVKYRHGCHVRGGVGTVCVKPRGPVGLSDGVPCGEGGASWRTSLLEDDCV